MNIQFVSHASVLIDTSDAVIWTDPWLEGTAFNESWALYPAPSITQQALDTVTHIWISHEHPDHFHLPTLRGLPESLKESVTILFQKNNSQKMFDALRKIGFKKYLELPQREILALTEATSIYCYQVGNMDSALGVMAGGEVLFNINDAELNQKDCDTIKMDLKKIDVVLNQFSVAGYSGLDDRELHLRKLADGILDNVVANHRDLGAKHTLPFASMIYFCREDNAYMNDYSNTVVDVHARLSREGLSCVALYPGESWNIATAHDSESSLQKYRAAYESFQQAAEISSSAIIPLEKIEQAYTQRFKQIESHYWKIFRRPLKPVNIHIPDLNCNVLMSMRTLQFQKIAPSPDCDLIINSQPLWFVFAMPFGCQTLGVSARYVLRRNARNWKLYRILFSMNNAEVYLSIAFFNRSNLSWIRQRASGLANQLFYQIKRM